MSLQNKKNNDLSNVLAIAAEMQSNIQSQTTDNIPVPRNVQSHIVHHLETTDFIKRKSILLKKAIDFLPEKTNLSSIPDDFLLDILSDATQISMAVRQGILGTFDCNYQNRLQKLTESLNVFVFPPTDNIVVQVALSPLISKAYKGSYNVYWELKHTLDVYSKKYPLPILDDGEKLIIIYKRYTSFIDNALLCDNDNWEMKRTTNAITEALNHSDNPKHFSMLYTTVSSDYNMVEITVIKQENLPNFMQYLASPFPTKSNPKLDNFISKKSGE